MVPLLRLSGIPVVQADFRYSERPLHNAATSPTIDKNSTDLIRVQ